MINILDARDLIQKPRLYSCFLIWLIQEIFESWPELGEVQKPKLVLMFDEAHLLFKDASKSFLERMELVVRLVRSKGVGVYFITQSPSDIPDAILAQLGNRIQHALRAYSEKDQKALKAVAATYRSGEDLAKRIAELGVGEVVASTLDEKAVPSQASVYKIKPPRSNLGPAAEEARRKVQEGSALYSRFRNFSPAKAAMNENSAPQEKPRSNAAVAKQQKAPRAGSKRQTPLQAFFVTFARTLARVFVALLLGWLKGKAKSRK